MSIWIKRLTFVIAATLLFLAAQPDTLAGSATWGLNPSSADWTTAGNWVPSTVPNGASDIATFGTSSVTNLFINSTIVEVDSIAFNSGASPYTISVEVSNLFLSGTGVVNNSGSVQSFVTPITENNNGAIFFSNNATAGEMTNFGGEGGDFVFNDSSSAGSATFDVTSGGLFQASMTFWDNTTAADATITVSLGIVGVYENATAGNAVFTVTNDAILFIADDATADHAVATCIHGSSIDFQQFASAGEGHFTAVGATSSGEAGSDIEFTGSATAANGTFVINGGTGPDVAGAFMTFLDSTTAGNATITVNGGVSGGGGGAIFFEGHSKGGTASLSLLGNGEMDIGNSRTAAGVTIGSLEGDGMVFLGPKTLAIGSNNQSTTFSGVIQDGGISQGTGGSLTKRGRGTLILTGANTYTGATTVSGGALKVTNTFGSGTGTGAVQLNAGTLGGSGLIAGATSIGTGSGAGAFLAPSAGTNVQATLAFQSALTFKADATYTYTFRAKRNMARTDEVFANGIIINSGATIALRGQTQGRLTTGLTLTLISNTSANPISGTFSNLPDAGIVTINGNNFQASYEGGDGNDLTLTVVP
jgi:autotransporter-associated beta strand protein